MITDTALDWFKNKRWAYDASQRMPLIVRYPKSIPAGSRSNAIIENIDFPALMLDYAGIEVPSSMQGRSFRKICETGAEPGGWKQASYYRYWMHMAHHDNPGEMAIRTKTHQLIYFYGCDYDGGNQTPPGCIGVFTSFDGCFSCPLSPALRGGES